MRFLDVKLGALLCFLNGFAIAVLVSILETSNSVINCIISVPDCDLPNGTQLSNLMSYS